MRETFLLFDLLQFFGVLALPAIGTQDAWVIVADHFAYFFVAMLRANLIDCRRLAVEGHQVRHFSADAPSRVVGVDRLLLFDLAAQSLITPRHRASARACADQRLGNRALRHCQTGQAFAHTRHFALGNTLAVMKRCRRRLRPRPEPVRRGTALIRRNLQMTPAHFALAATASANVNALGFDYGLRRGGKFRVGDDLCLVPYQIAAAGGASGVVDWYLFDRATVVFL